MSTYEYNSTIADYSIDPLERRTHDGILLKKKQQQWAQERAAANEAWFPFGTPGGGAPLRKKKSTSSGDLINGSSSSHPIAVSTDAYQLQQQHQQLQQQQQLLYHQHPSSSSPHNAQPITNYHQISSTNPYQFYYPPHPAIVTYQSPPLDYSSVARLPHIHPSSSMLTAPMQQQQQYAPIGPMGISSSLMPIQQSSTVHYQPTTTTNTGTIIQRAQTPQQILYQPIINHSTITNKPASYVSTPASYTEQWANQLNYWEAGGQSTDDPSLLMQPNNLAVVHPMMMMMTSSDSYETTNNENGRSIIQESIVSSPHSPRRRRAMSVAGMDDDRHQKMVETKLTYDDQIAEKQRFDAQRAAEERRETMIKERERYRIEASLSNEAQLEQNRWKQHEMERSKHEQHMIDALEKARNEAAILRKARLFNHVLDADETVQIEAHNSIATNQPDEFARARMQLQAIERQKRMDQEVVEKHRTMLSPNNSAISNDERPIRPSPNTNNITSSSSSELSRNLPGRYSMREKRRPSTITPIQRSDSSEKLKNRSDSEVVRSDSQVEKRDDDNRNQSINRRLAKFDQTPAVMEKSQNKKVVVNDDSNNTDAISTTNVNNASPSQILDKRLSFDDTTKNKSDQQTNSGILNPLFDQIVTRPRKMRSQETSDSKTIIGNQKNRTSDSMMSSNTDQINSSISSTRRLARSTIPTNLLIFSPSSTTNHSTTIKQSPDNVGHSLLNTAISPMLNTNGNELKRTPNDDGKSNRSSIDSNKKQHDDYRYNIDNSLERFNHKSSQYRSFNTKKGGSDRQNKILEQLAVLRAQLKDKQAKCIDSNTFGALSIDDGKVKKDPSKLLRSNNTFHFDISESVQI